MAEVLCRASRGDGLRDLGFGHISVGRFTFGEQLAGVACIHARPYLHTKETKKTKSFVL